MIHPDWVEKLMGAIHSRHARKVFICSRCSKEKKKPAALYKRVPVCFGCLDETEFQAKGKLGERLRK